MMMLVVLATCDVRLSTKRFNLRVMSFLTIVLVIHSDMQS